jgi:glycosyltransferase involved in cell wall biosynthesis
MVSRSCRPIHTQEAEMKFDIYFTDFLKANGEDVGGGGIGTQLAFLCPLLDRLGYDTTIYQCYHKRLETTFGKTVVIGIPDYPGPNRPTELVVKHFRSVAELRAKSSERIELFAADFFSVRNNNPLAISIMQGLSWDAPIDILTEKKIFRTKVGENILRLRKQIQGVERFENCYNRVVADLTFLNWYRSFRGPNYEGKVWYNPNPAIKVRWNASRDKKGNRKKPVRIIFARRLVPEKGTRLAIEVFEELLAHYPAIEVTIAGEGPDRSLFEQKFSGNPRVTITTYKTEEATEYHQDFDIALVPSVCGEATSFSILEAMSAGCAVVATNMAGIITEIISMHNGILCSPNKESLIEGVKFLLENPHKRLEIQKNAWESSQNGFTFNDWRERWKSILLEVVNEKETAEESLKKRRRRFYYFM